MKGNSGLANKATEQRKVERSRMNQCGGRRGGGKRNPARKERGKALGKRKKVHVVSHVRANHELSGRKGAKRGRYLGLQINGGTAPEACAQMYGKALRRKGIREETK